jgi:peptidoglycan hydrolase-like protein with peptidoglycan-binding domain
MIGIDMASVSGNDAPDWRAAQKAGVGFAFLRASYAAYSNSKKRWSILPDPHFARDWKKIPVTKGAFMFPEPRALEGPKEQVKVFVNSIKSQGGLERGVDFPPVLDIEFPGGLRNRTRKQMVQWMMDAVKGLQDAFDVNPILYTSARVWDGEDTDALNADTLLEMTATLKECPLWLARYPFAYNLAPKQPPDGYPPVPKLWGTGNVWFWQYQGNVKRMPGFTGLIDLDKFYPMKIGEKGEKVKWVQTRISVKPDGIFGPNTQKALINFQIRKGLATNGVVDLQTFAALAWV